MSGNRTREKTPNRPRRYNKPINGLDKKGCNQRKRAAKVASRGWDDNPPKDTTDPLPEGSVLSVTTMLICTNDGITGVSGMVPPATGSASVNTMAYDAGTEANSELTVDIVDPCGAAGPVAHDPDGNERTGTS